MKEKTWVMSLRTKKEGTCEVILTNKWHEMEINMEEIITTRINIIFLCSWAIVNKKKKGNVHCMAYATL